MVGAGGHSDVVTKDEAETDEEEMNVGEKDELIKAEVSQEGSVSLIKNHR